MRHLFLNLLFSLALLASQATLAAPPSGNEVPRTLTSTVLAENRIGLNVNRQIRVDLPPSYADSRKSYPVVNQSRPACSYNLFLNSSGLSARHFLSA